MHQSNVLRVLLQERAKLLAYIWAIVRDEHLAEDVFQDVSLLAIDKREEIHGEEVLMPWLRRTARYRALHAVQSRKQRPVLLSEGILDALDECWEKYDAITAPTLVDALRHCMSRLTTHAREIITLRYVEGLNGAQVAVSRRTSGCSRPSNDRLSSSLALSHSVEMRCGDSPFTVTSYSDGPQPCNVPPACCTPAWT
jgi:RNA polymerase sigma-70 factor, ECF subfamily